MSLSQPKYKYPIEDQNDYKARVYFTTIIEEPPTIDPSAFENEGNDIGLISAAQFLGNAVTAGIRAGKSTKGETVKLYLPPAIQVQDGVNFEGAELGVRGGAALSAAQGGDETTLAEIASNTLGLGTVDKLMTAIKDPEVARAVISGVAGVSGRGQNVVNSATQTTLNPNIRAVFKSVNLREHSFAFKFIPRSQEEAQEVRAIIDWFRMELYPEPTADIGGLKVAYKFPNKFLIRMRYGANTPIVTQYIRSHLINMTTNYNPSNMSFYYDGEFQEIDLTLNFREYRTLSKEDIQAGYDDLDDPDKVIAQNYDFTNFPTYAPPGSSPSPASSASQGYPQYTAPATRDFINSYSKGAPAWNQAQYEEASGIRNATWGTTNPPAFAGEPGGPPLGDPLNRGYSPYYGGPYNNYDKKTGPF